MKFKDLSQEQQFQVFQAYKKGELNSPQALESYMTKFEPSIASKALSAVDTGVSSVANLANQGIEKAKENPLLKNRIERWGDLLKIGSLPGQYLSKGMNAGLDAAGVPEGPSLEEALPKTVKATGFNPNVRDVGALLALEGVGQAGSALKGVGERGMIRAFEEGKPPLPAGASKEMVGDILDKNYLPHHEAASDLITDSILNLRERGMAGSGAAKDISDTSRINVSPERIEQLHEFFPEHPTVRNLKKRLDASREGAITKDFIEEKPGYIKQEKIMQPSEVVQSQAPQGDLFDQNYYANPEAYSKRMPDFVNHPERGTFPAQPEIQKPIEPELAGEAVKVPANYEFKETAILPEGRYEFSPESLYDVFSYANKNKHKAWQLDPITQQPIARNESFGKMMHGLRQDLRSVKTPLNDTQIEAIKSFDPEFQGTTVGEAVAGLNADTYGTIKNQKQLTKKSVSSNPLNFMEGVHSNPDRRAFAQKLGRDYNLNSILEYADKYGASKDYAKELAKYMENGVQGEGINYNKLAKHAMYGGIAPALSYEAGKLIGSPVRRYKLAKDVGNAVETVKPSGVDLQKIIPDKFLGLDLTKRANSNIFNQGE